MASEGIEAYPRREGGSKSVYAALFCDEIWTLFSARSLVQAVRRWEMEMDVTQLELVPVPGSSTAEVDFGSQSSSSGTAVMVRLGAGCTQVGT